MSRKKIGLLVALLTFQFCIFYVIGNHNDGVFISSTSKDSLRYIEITQNEGGVIIRFESEVKGEYSGSKNVYRSSPLSKEDINITWDTNTTATVHINVNPVISIPIAFTNSNPDIQEEQSIQTGSDGIYQYRIREDQVELSFDEGVTWKNTIVPASELQIFAAPQWNRLGSESFQIAPELTVFQYVNSKGYLVSMSSIDEGTTWITNVSSLGPYQTSCYTMKFQNQLHGYVFYVQFEGLQYFKTEDGGATWNESPIQNPVASANMKAAVAIEQMLMISYGEGTIYQSSDQGLHFTRIDVPKGFPTEDLRMMKKVNDILYLDAWQSSDQGITWVSSQ